MEDQKRLTLLMVNHLKSQMTSGALKDESLESIEIAVQCIEWAYSLSSNESLTVNTKLEKIVQDHYQQASTSKVIICFKF